MGISGTSELRILMLGARQQFHQEVKETTEISRGAVRSVGWRVLLSLALHRQSPADFITSSIKSWPQLGHRLSFRLTH